MTERLADVMSRIGSVRQLDQVVVAMRGIAAARAREAQNRLAAIRAYAGAIGEAIGLALSATPQPEREAARTGSTGGRAIIALCSEQGFVGAFNERVLNATQVAMSTARSTRLLLIGDRGLVVSRERGVDVDWSASMLTHVGQVGALADKISDQLYIQFAGEEITEVAIVHAIPGAESGVEVVTKTLAPFDYSRFPAARPRNLPLLHAPPRVLLARLAEEYMFAELCEAAMLSFAAENEARMRAMTSARENVEGMLDGLVARSQTLRQEEITNEIIELFGGARTVG